MKILIPVDSANYNPDFFNIHNNIYHDTDIIYTVMGKDAENVSNSLPQCHQKYVLPSAHYSYTRAINFTIKKLKPEDLVILSDSWTVFSLWQMNKDIIALGNDNFIEITNWFQSENASPINYDDKRFMLSIINRIVRTRVKTESYPVISIKNSILLDKINGLDESFSTEISRSYLSYQLEGLGLSKLKCEKDCYFLSHDITKYDYSKDENTIKALMNSELIFNKSNENKQWGSTKNTPKPEEKKSIEVKRIEPKLIEPKLIEQKIELDEVPIRSDDKKIYINTNKNETRNRSLILIGDLPKHIICSTPMLREVKNNKISIDILVNNKNNISTSLLPYEYFDNIYDKTDLSFIDFNLYKIIIKTSGANVKIPPSSKLIECKNDTNDMTQANHTVLSQIIKPYEYQSVLYPVCNYTPFRKILQPNTFIINIAGEYPRWKYYDNIISKISKNRENTVILISLENERLITDPELFKMNKNVISILNLSLLECAGLLKLSTLNITNQFSDVMWLCYAMKVDTILIEGPTHPIPNVPWLNRIPKEQIVSFKDSIDVAQNVLDRITDTTVWKEICKRV